MIFHHRKNVDKESWNGYPVVWQNDSFRYILFFNLSKKRSWILQMWKRFPYRIHFHYQDWPIKEHMTF